MRESINDYYKNSKGQAPTSLILEATGKEAEIITLRQSKGEETGRFGIWLQPGSNLGPRIHKSALYRDRYSDPHVSKSKRTFHLTRSRGQK